ncbi:hypothetical protein BU16DRAFT_197041 [Lophium mytilinum]|uniref:Uncharacterized protein n=1 Tax=Lophium mytilinum TaxID=390894 RepID=A0A6A6RA08_9PEZI|nr:hypothetical protein BU16DRAFT_197041 [Lophium mytilinum]
MNVFPTPESVDSSLLRLPNELLLEILTLAIGRKNTQLDNDRSKDHWTAWSLTQVCKRISEIAYPLLYRNIDFMSPTLCSLLPISTAGNQLSHSLYANPSLGAMCKELVIWIPPIEDKWIGNMGDNDYQLCEYVAATDLLTKLPNVQNLESCNAVENSDHVWRMLEAAFDNMPRITDLTISQDYGSIFIERLFTPATRFPALRRLHIVGCLAFSSSNIADAAWFQAPLAPLTALNIHDFAGSPSDFATFLSWPQALSDLTFHPDKATFTLSDFQAILAPHQSTLKKLYVGDLGRTNNRLDLTDFPKLGTLNFPALAHRETLGDHARLLAAPALRSFSWHFGVDQGLNGLEAFQQPEADALRAFVKGVLACGCPLRRVEIWFLGKAEFSIPIAKDRDAVEKMMRAIMRYPWDWMDELRDDFEKLGVLLTYDPPFGEPRSVTREQYEEEFQRWTSGNGGESES